MIKFLIMLVSCLFLMVFSWLIVNQWIIKIGYKDYYIIYFIVTLCVWIYRDLHQHLYKK